MVLYDNLVDRRLLDYAPQALKIFVGKIPGDNRNPQASINALIVHYAKSHGHVVRLKGGDPFVFGRGSEEVEEASRAGIQSCVVPGISSVTSVPTLAGFPLTKRGIAQSFWVITATTKSGELCKDIHDGVHSRATLVVLMGMSKLPAIVSVFKEAGRGDVPIAIIQNGSRENEKVGFATIDSILERVQALALSNPAIIIIGEVVNFRSVQSGQ